MATVKVQFKAKVVGGFFKFPMIKKSHIVSGISGNGRIMNYSNSDMFESVLNRHLKKDLMYPIGLTCMVNDLSAELGISVGSGFLNTFTFTFDDNR